MPSFLIDSFIGGIADYDDKGRAGAFAYGKDLDIRKRNRDSISVGQALADDLAAGGIMTAPVVQVVNSTDGNSYWGLSNGRILKRTSAGVWSLVYTDSSGILRGIAEWVNDNGETGIYWASDTKLHRHPQGGDWSGDVDNNAGSPAQTYPKTNLTDTPNHYMKVVNGSLLINNGATMALVGYDESYTNDALTLYLGNLGQVILDIGLYAVIGANRDDDSEESWVLLWDMTAPNYLDRQPLPVADINSLIQTERIFMQIGSDGAIYLYNDETRLPIVQIPEGGQTANEGACNDSGLAMFGVYGNGNGYSGVYGLGRKKKNAPFVLNLEYQLDCDAIHAVKKVSSTLLVAYELDGDYGVKKVDSTAKASQGIYRSLVLKYPPALNKEASTDMIQVTCAPLPANCSIEVWRRRNRIETGGTDFENTTTGEDDGFFQCSLVDGSGTLSEEGATQGIFKVGDLGTFMEVELRLNTSANTTPEVFRVEPYFKQ